jgi:hypothetical protein
MKKAEREDLLAFARCHPMTEAEREAQCRSFVYGNTNIENANITRQSIDTAATRLETVHGRKRSLES